MQLPIRTVTTITHVGFFNATSKLPFLFTMNSPSDHPQPSPLDLAEDGGHQDLGDTVRVSVGGGSAILKVTAAAGGSLTRNTDGSAAVGDTPAELLDGAGLVLAGQTELVVLTVLLDTLGVVRLEGLDGLLDVLHATLGTHVLGGEVGVQARAVPWARDGLGVQGDLDAELLSDAGKEETGHPELVTHADADARADLELPLTGQNLGVGTRDVDASI